jgi:murein peptide amidase A
MHTIVSGSCRFAGTLVALLATPTIAHAHASDPTVVKRELLGRSVLGKQIDAIETGDSDEARKVLVVGNIHGDEPAVITIARTLAQLPPPADADVWIIPTLNPDGVAAHTRQNADGVDLNRNFPWHWRPLGQHGYRYYSGPRALSEPESRLAFHLILRLRPAVSIWFHQPDGLVDESGRDVRIERRFAELVGLPLVQLPRFPGSVTSWENHRFPGTTAFVVELRAGSLSLTAATRFARAVHSVAGGS